MHVHCSPGYILAAPWLSNLSNSPHLARWANNFAAVSDKKVKVTSPVARLTVAELPTKRMGWAQWYGANVKRVRRDRVVGWPLG